MQAAILQADAVAVSLSAALARVVPALAKSAAALMQSGVVEVFGYARLSDYARERLNRSSRWVSDLARLEAHFERLPALRAAVAGEDGGSPLHTSAALALGGVATRSDVGEWIAVARRTTLAGLRRIVRSGHGPAAPAGLHSAPGSVEPCVDEDGDDRSEVLLQVPALARAAFRETLDLYRAVEGYEAPVASFVEALLAESMTEPLPVIVDGDPAGEAHAADGRRGVEREVVEAALERAAVGWRHLDTDAGPGTARPEWAVRLAGSTLARLKKLKRRAGQGDARDLDSQMRGLLGIQNELEIRLGEVLSAMGEMAAWMHLGFADVGHYAERRLGMCRTAAEDRVWVARTVRSYALIRMAYEKGDLGWEATRHILRVLKGCAADEAIQRAWIERGRRATVRRLKDEVRALQRQTALEASGCDAGGGQADGGAVDAGGAAGRGVSDEDPTPSAGVRAPEADRDRATAGAGLWTTDRAVARMNRWARRAPLPMTDEAWHASLRREPGSTRALMGTLGQALAGQAEAQTSMWKMNGDIMRLRLPTDLAVDLHEAIGQRRVWLHRLVRQVPELEPWPNPEAPASVLVTRTFSSRGWRAPLWVGLLGLLEDFVLVWDQDPSGRKSSATAGDRSAEARWARRPGQTVPHADHQPAGMSGVKKPGRRRSRAEVFAREGYRCSAPGCTSRRNLHEHHIVFKSRLGGEGLTNRTAPCSFHHLRCIHQGLASCRGEAPLGITWRLGREDVGEIFINELRQ